MTAGALVAVGVLAPASSQATPAVTAYPAHTSFTLTPNGGGFEGRGQTAVLTITSPKAACRAYRRFTLDVVSPTGYEIETHRYRTDARGTWTLDVLASPGPGRVIITASAKRLDRTHRCKATGTVVGI